MIVTVFRLRVSEDPAAQEAYAALTPHIYSLATAMPGLVAAKRFTADDGERVTIVEFEDEQSHQAWATQHEHVAAKILGRESFFSEYRIQVCEVKKTMQKTRG